MSISFTFVTIHLLAATPTYRKIEISNRRRRIQSNGLKLKSLITYFTWEVSRNDKFLRSAASNSRDNLNGKLHKRKICCYFIIWHLRGLFHILLLTNLLSLQIVPTDKQGPNKLQMFVLFINCRLLLWKFHLSSTPWFYLHSSTNLDCILYLMAEMVPSVTLIRVLPNWKFQYSVR